MKPDTSPARELTRRSILTGVVLGAILTPCNVYSGLKIGWSFNMSIVAALLSYGFWNLAIAPMGGRHWGLLENNINQTTASSAASIISGGLVAPIPALALITGQTLPLHWLMVWVAVVSLLGVTVAVSMRRQLLVVEQLTFPAGVATAETVQKIYARGAEAAARVRMLLGALALSASIKLVESFTGLIRAWPMTFQLSGSGAMAGRSLGGGQLGFALDPSLLLVGFGAIIGLRAGLSLLLGAVLAWAIIAPKLLAAGGVVLPADAGTFWYPALVEWLLWPGVALMVSASLTAFALAVWRRQRHASIRDTELAAADDQPISRRAFWLAFAVTLLLAVTAQVALFDIALWVAVLAVLLAYALAVVAARVVGETGIPPIGALGKVSQLSFGVLAPSNLTTNLMTANVAGGAAGQCADLLNDLKTGHLIGATPRLQVTAQLFGILTGSVVGSLAYLALIPDPQSMLITAEWPAPAVVTWKAVAEVLSGGLTAVPAGALPAMGVAGVLGVLLAMLRSLGPAALGRWVPSAPAAGLAFVIPASNSISLFIGSMAAALATAVAPRWSARFVIALAAGLVAGESLVGVVVAFLRLGGVAGAG